MLQNVAFFIVHCMRPATELYRIGNISFLSYLWHYFYWCTRIRALNNDQLILFFLFIWFHFINGFFHFHWRNFPSQFEHRKKNTRESYAMQRQRWKKNLRKCNDWIMLDAKNEIISNQRVVFRSKIVTMRHNVELHLVASCEN